MVIDLDKSFCKRNSYLFFIDEIISHHPLIFLKSLMKSLRFGMTLEPRYLLRHLLESTFLSLQESTRGRILQSMVKRIKSHLNPWVLKKYEEFKSLGLPIIILSNSPSVYVEAFAQSLGIYGRGAQLNETFPLNHKRKLVELRQWCESLDLELEYGFGIGNCHSDYDVSLVLKTAIFIKPKFRCRMFIVANGSKLNVVEKNVFTLEAKE
jgi:hypothetical protein